MSSVQNNKSKIRAVSEKMHSLSYIEFISQKDWENLRDFIAYYPDITAVVTAENYKSVEKFIDADFEIEFGRGILHFVCRNLENVPNSVELIKSILDRNQININSKSVRGGYTALFTAIANAKRIEDIHTIKFLIDSGADINSINEDNWTPLIFSTRISKLSLRLELTRLLIESGADLEKDTTVGQTALQVVARHVGTSKLHFDLFKLLIESRAKFDIRDKFGKTPVDTAREFIGNEETNDHVPELREYLDKLEGKTMKPPVEVPLVPVETHKEPAETKTVANLFESVAARTTSVEHFEASIPEAHRKLHVYRSAVAAGNFKFPVSAVPKDFLTELILEFGFSAFELK